MIVTIKLSHEVPIAYKYYQELKIELKSQDDNCFYGVPLELRWTDESGHSMMYGSIGYPKYAWKMSN